MKNNKSSAAVLCAASVVFMISHAHAQAPTDAPPATTASSASEPASEPVDVEVFKSARILSGPRSNTYPLNAVGQRREGWVSLNAMIDPRGKPYEVMVMLSNGDPEFEKAALRSVDKMTFAPALSGETPIDSSFTFKMVFSIHGNMARGARREFISVYRKARAAVKENDKATADAVFPKLQGENLYEEAFEHYARASYAQKWGTPEELLRELMFAVAGEVRPGYLPRDIFMDSMIRIFTLQTKTQDYGSALRTWQRLEPLLSTAEREPLAKVAAQLKAFQASTEPYPRAYVLDRHGRNAEDLLRTRFSVDVTSGDLNEIKLRCEKQYRFFKYQPGVEYSISTRDGPCEIELIGAPGTKLTLIQ